MFSLWILSGTAVSIALIHTVLGPDHYIPFVVLARANRWSTARTAAVTALCGVGHVLSSVFLGMVGIGAGIALSRLERVESARGNLASYLLIGFGMAYALWGLRRIRRGRPHSHDHLHEDGTLHDHPHRHQGGHRHIHGPSRNFAMGLFILFGLGPCEPLIPLLMFPAAVHGPFGVFAVSAVFGAVTIGTMVGTVLLLRRGLSSAPATGRLAPYGRVLAGSAIAVTGIAVRALGL